VTLTPEQKKMRSTAQSRYMQRLYARGLCMRCRKKNETWPLRYCAECRLRFKIAAASRPEKPTDRETKKAAQNRYTAKRYAEQRCITCGRMNATFPIKRCLRCRMARNEQARNGYEKS
jgi:hypothetical protein